MYTYMSNKDLSGVVGYRVSKIMAPFSGVPTIRIRCKFGLPIYGNPH